LRQLKIALCSGKYTGSAGNNTAGIDELTSAWANFNSGF
jgi:hypothetical protein